MAAIPALAAVAQRALASVGGQVFQFVSGYQLTGHASVSGSTPIITGVATGISGTPTIVGTDAAGKITYTTTGAAPAIGANAFQINFAVAYQKEPFVQLTAVDGIGATTGYKVLSPGPAHFYVCLNFAPANNTTYSLYYWVVGNVG